MVAAAGNQADGTGSLDLPAADPFLIAVGASDTQHTADPADDTVADFSSRDAVRPPDVVAPGTGVISLRVPGSTLDEEFPAARIGETLLPRQRHVAGRRGRLGLVARLLQARPDLTPDQVKALLRAGAVDLPADVSADGAGASTSRARSRCRRRRTRRRPSSPRCSTSRAVGGPDEEAQRHRARRRDRGERLDGRTLVRPQLVGPQLVGPQLVGQRLGRERMEAEWRGRLRAAAIWLLIALDRRHDGGALPRRSSATFRPTPDVVRVPWWALAIGFAATEVFVIHAHIRGSAHTLSLSELPLVVGLLLATPQDLVIAQVVGPVARAAARAPAAPPVKVAFNIAQFALTATLTVIVLHALVPAPAEIGPGVWTATFVAVGARLARRRRPRARRDRARRGRAAVAASCCGCSAPTSWSRSPTRASGWPARRWSRQDWHAGWLIVPPAVVLILAYRAYLSEHTKHQSLEFLYGVARSLSARARHRDRAGRPARAHARVVPRAHGRDHPVRRRRRPAAAHRRSTPAASAQTMQPVDRRARRRRCAPASATSTRRVVSRSRAPPRWRPTWPSAGSTRRRSRRCPARRGWSA